MALLIFLFSLLLLFVYFWLKQQKKFWTSRGFPSAEFNFPFGSLEKIGSEISMSDGLDEFYKKFKGKGPVVGLFYFVKPIVLLIDPGLIRCVLATNFECFQNRGLFYNRRDDPISANLLALEGELRDYETEIKFAECAHVTGSEWRERRVKLTPTFTTGKMRLMFEIIDTIGDTMVKVIGEALKTSGDVEIHEFLCRFTTDSISQVAFGLDSKSLEDPNSEMRKYGKEVVDLSAFDFLKIFFTSSFPELSRKLHLTANKRSVINFFYNTFTENMRERERTGVVRRDFMQLLLDLKRTTALTISELAAESFLFFLGGFETSSSLSVFVIYELALNKEIQDKLRQEIVLALEENEGKLSYDLVFNLKYLDMVINETLRKYPAAYLIMRKATKEFIIPNTEMTIPAGTTININIFSIHHDPEYYPDPETFDPERFTVENVRKRKPFTFIPFGDGPRKCIGGKYGLLQAKIAVLKLIANFEISPSAKTTIPMKFSPPAFFLAPINKMWLSLRPIL